MDLRNFLTEAHESTHPLVQWWWTNRRDARTATDAGLWAFWTGELWDACWRHKSRTGVKFRPLSGNRKYHLYQPPCIQHRNHSDCPCLEMGGYSLPQNGHEASWTVNVMMLQERGGHATHFSKYQRKRQIETDNWAQNLSSPAGGVFNSFFSLTKRGVFVCSVGQWGSAEL